MFTIGQPQVLTIELICQHPPHKCRCRHNVKTEVNREELTNELIKYNPALLKYLGKRNIGQTNTKQIETRKENNHEKIEGKDEKYQSIVEEKGLPFCLDDQFEIQKDKKKMIEEKVQEKQRIKQQNEDKGQPIVNVAQKIEPIKEMKEKKVPQESDRQKQIKKFHKDMRNQSRYLSDTAFRKYFNRQCFQNYGRNNTTGTADGIIYGNYMKTFNINPHTGENIPVNQQTFYHALVSGSPQKYQTYTQEVQLGKTHDLTPDRNKNPAEKGHFMEKQKLDVEKMLTDNQKHSRIQQKYENLHLKKSKSPKNTLSQKEFKSPSRLGIVTKKQFHQDSVNQEKIQSLKKKQSNTEEALRPNTESYYIPEKGVQEGKKKTPQLSVTQVQLQKKTSIIDHLNSVKKVSSPKSLTCEHSLSSQNIDCACCLNKMKRIILDLTEKDPDLADRIIASAKKNVLYKNFSLNNFENAAMNPKNYRREDGQLNIYED